MNDILQCKALANEIEEALKEKVIGDVHVKYDFDPSAFGTSIMVTIDDPYKKHTPYYAYYGDPRWYYRIALDEFTIKNAFDDGEALKLISKIVSDVLDKYKEHVYKRYFFD